MTLVFSALSNVEKGRANRGPDKVVPPTAFAKNTDRKKKMKKMNNIGQTRNASQIYVTRKRVDDATQGGKEGATEAELTNVPFTAGTNATQ